MTAFTAVFPTRGSSPTDPVDEMEWYFKYEPPVWSVILPGPRAGDAVLLILATTSTLIEYLDLDALHLQLRLDGSLVEDWDLKNPDMGWSGTGERYENLTLTPGITEVNLSLVGDVVDGPVGIPVYNETYTVLRVTNSTAQGDVASFLDGGGHVVVVDPGVEATVDRLPVVPEFDLDIFDDVPYRSIDATMFNGSRLVVTAGGVGPDDYVRVLGVGNGTIDVSGLDCSVVHAYAYGPLLKLTDVGCDMLQLSGSDWLGRPGAFEGVRVCVREGLSFSGMSGCDLTLEDSDVMLGGSSELACENGSATYRDTIFRAQSPQAFDILHGDYSSPPPRSVTLERCTMSNVSLLVPSWSFEAPYIPEARVEGCTFSGGTTNLVLMEQETLTEGPSWPAWLTVADLAFDGVGAGIIAVPALLARAMAESTFTGGATALAAYPFDVQLRGDTSPQHEVRVLEPFSWKSEALQKLDGLNSFIEMHILLDVTGDPARIASPGTVDLIIGWSPDDSVVWFASPDVLPGENEILVPPWGDAGERLIDLVYRILDDSSFWSR
jgi:hypothetical protein